MLSTQPDRAGAGWGWGSGLSAKLQDDALSPCPIFLGYYLSCPLSSPAQHLQPSIHYFLILRQIGNENCAHLTGNNYHLTSLIYSSSVPSIQHV